MSIVINNDIVYNSIINKYKINLKGVVKNGKKSNIRPLGKKF